MKKFEKLSQSLFEHLIINVPETYEIIFDSIGMNEGLRARAIVALKKCSGNNIDFLLNLVKRKIMETDVILCQEAYIQVLEHFSAYINYKNQILDILKEFSSKPNLDSLIKEISLEVIEGINEN